MNEMTTLFGDAGEAVGSRDGDWVFDEAGNAVAYVFESELFALGTGARLGQIVAGVVYDFDNRPIAHGEGAKSQLVKPLHNRLSPLIPRLQPSGAKVAGERISVEKLLPFKLCQSLGELRAQK